MILSLLLQIESSSDDWYRRPAALRALGYALFSRADPALADRLHNESGDKPFTLAVFPAEGGGLCIRATALNDEIGRAMVRMTDALVGGPPLIFGKWETSVTVRNASLDLPPFAGIIEYADLIRQPFRPHVALRFVTPTAFSQGGDRHLPLPVPDLLLRGWARRFNAFAPEPHRLEAETVESLTQHVGLAEAHIETVTVLLQPQGCGPGRAKLIGFLGEIELEALRPSQWSEEERRAFACLTTFSAYCGTGVKTSMGLGSTLPL